MIPYDSLLLHRALLLHNWGMEKNGILRAQLDELLECLGDKPPTVPAAEYEGRLRFQNRRRAGMRGEAASCSPSIYEDPRAVADVEARLDLVHDAVVLYGYTPTADVDALIEEILAGIPSFTPSGRFPFCAFAEMSHNFFYLRKAEQLQARLHGAEKDFLYRPHPKRPLAYRIPSSGRWVSLPPFIPERLPGAAISFHWGASKLFAERMFVELRIAQKVDVLPPRPVQGEDLAAMIQELTNTRFTK